MTDKSIQTKERSAEYTRLLTELKNSFVSAANMATRLYDQGKKDGLSNEVIRHDIEKALEGVVKERRLRMILLHTTAILYYYIKLVIWTNL